MKEKSAFITIIGRPNVGKSSLMNRIIAQKVAIVSDKPQTTRTKYAEFTPRAPTSLFLLILRAFTSPEMSLIKT